MSRACPVCLETASKREILATSPDLPGSAPLRMLECRQCALVYMPDMAPTNDLYTTPYYGTRRGLVRWFFEPFNHFWVRKKARRLLALGTGRIWLDYGCGRGDLLEALAAEGAEIYGIETQPDCADALAAKWKGRVGRRLQDLNLPPNKLDGVSFYHVLEHMEDPHALLVELRRLSQPGATLFVAVPNWNSWERSMFGDRWFHLDVPRHIQQFTSANLSRLLERAGWTVRDIHFKVRAYDVFGLFQTLLNVGPGPRNYFYRRLKRGESFPGAEGWVGLAWNLLAIAPAAAIAFLVTPLLACLGRTGTFEVTATPHA